MSLIAIAILLVPVQQLEPIQWSERELKIINSLSPSLKAQPLPSVLSNRYANDLDAAELGRLLFFEKSLSPSGDVSCATCHNPKFAWTDGLALSEGVAVTPFNAPTVLNTAYTQWQFWDGRSDSLWSQALQPIENALEMNSSRTFVLKQIAATPRLKTAWEKAFGAMPDLSDDGRFLDNACPAPLEADNPFAEKKESDDPRHQAWINMGAEDQQLINREFAKLGKAIGAFERQLISGPAPFDFYAASLRGDNVLGDVSISDSAQRGLRFFIGEGQCLSCHFGPNLSDGEFHNVGLALPEGDELNDEGRPDGIRKLRIDPFNGRGEFSDANDWDSNQHLLYMFYNEHTFGAYKTPSLRNVSRTAPYGHDGRFAGLREVLEFYSELPGLPPIGHREETLLPLLLEEQELLDLIEFLNSLEGQPVADSLKSNHPPQ